MSASSMVNRATGILRDEGVGGLTARALRKAHRKWGDNAEELNLLADDVADSARVAPAPAGRVVPEGEPLRIGWVVSAPGPASGGHTTMFRFVEALEQAGHTCVLYVYDGHGGPAAASEQLIRTWWPRVRAEIRDLADGLGGMDAYIATAWNTAHVLASRGAGVPGRRFYLAQDFEPYFYPRGSAYELAEDTYRFGFESITVGHMVADELRRRFGVESTVAEFGCDTSRYGVTAQTGRDDVVFYAKPGIARRGYELGVLALERFHRDHPDVTIHTFGIPAKRLPFPAEVHAHLTPDALNDLYNRCGAGLALSFTNVSLIASELLAAGVVPVVNDWPGTRADLDNPHVAWARPTPQGVADALADALSIQRAAGPRALRASVDALSWEPAKQAVVRAVERACARGDAPAEPETATARMERS
ncbi:glycosyl transferase family 1 [Leifsonia sp. LS1]|uniref:rhamnosyltransferase WsaF family glycosyltransferase n=1 Tax=Leifsonia sp. LS1 TaxID=2828483 RepID=UPI001CFD3FC4|nr:glycosyltransferase family 1 protein [Leifsonia sp. LS1]GIT79648.1 glycosyl transferase family 1 [Leifsonia sp. LS1]